MSSKLDIFSVLNFLDQNNLDVHKALSEDPDMLKEFEQAVGWLLPQWMVSAINEEDHAQLIENFNSYCNIGWFSFRKHPELQAKLLGCCGLGKKTRHRFFKPKPALPITKIRELLEHKYEDIREEEIAIWCQYNKPADVKRLAEALGYQKDDVKEILKSFDKVRKQYDG